MEVTNPTRPKLPLYARLGVPEVWLYDGHNTRILRLSGGQYESCDRSGALPALTAAALADFVEQGKTPTTLARRRVVRAWAREQTP